MQVNLALMHYNTRKKFIKSCTALPYVLWAVLNVTVREFAAYNYLGNAFLELCIFFGKIQNVLL